MACKNSIQRCRKVYTKLLRLYPEQFRERYAKGMVQTFNDLCTESHKNGEKLSIVFTLVVLDTVMGIIEENLRSMTIQKRRIVAIMFGVTSLLLIPLVAMQFTEEVNWGLMDFVVMGAALLGVGLAYELIARRSEKTLYRIAFGIGLISAFLLFWVNGAVGIIGSEGQPANLMYGGVFAVGLIGSLMARFEPRGMALTLFAAALTQMLVPVIALFIWPPSTISWSPGVLGVFVLSGFFAMLFVASALLFRRASASKNLSV